MKVELLHCLRLLSLCVLLTFGQNSAFEIKIYPVNNTEKKNLVVETRSSPTDALNSCFTSKTGYPKMAGNTTILKVINKYGPCFPRNITKSESDVHAEDEARIRAIAKSLQMQKDTLQVSTYSGTTVGGGNYVVRVDLGTPSKTLYLEMDTGSDLTWTQCRPCIQCYQQYDPIFNPAESSSFSDLPCSSPSCLYNLCADNSCGYKIQYLDKSVTIGLLATDVINFCACQTQRFRNFVFGCGINNVGLFGGTDGLLGLGRGSLSLISQTAALYGSYFSYCLPVSLSGTGYFALGGNGDTVGQPVFTPFSNAFSSKYAVDLLAISVGDTKISFSDAIPMMFDSGAAVTYLPTVLYNSVRELFMQKMSGYGYARVANVEPWDTCYDISGYTNIFDVPPIMGIYMVNDAVLTLSRNTLKVYSNSVACFAFFSTDLDFALFGNYQQRTFSVIHDIGRRRMGFDSGGC